MDYISTRAGPEVARVAFAEVLLGGLASDGGLYVPTEVPPLAAELGDSYAEQAVAVTWPFVTGSIGRDAYEAMVAEAYETFDHPEVCPLVRLDDRTWLVELWHGPTLAFKDVALQLVGRLFDHELAARDDRATVVVATSGDTGSAAIEACVGRDRLDIVVLHPRGRTSDIQRRQMTTVAADNVHNVAVEGTFDDCQDLLKALFADPGLRAELGLSAMNSINWARVMAQVTYHVTASRAVAATTGAEPMVVVPTGNFGNVLAGWYAHRMGAPIASLGVATNTNDVLARWVERGELVAEPVAPTWSPSMDIGVSSNLERVLWERCGRDGARVAELMTRFRELSAAEVPSDPVFRAASLDDGETLAEIARTHAETGRLVDPHTAVGIGVARRLRRGDEPVVCLATAHPAKFGEAVERATGVRAELPGRLVEVLEAPERYEELPADLDAVRSHLRATVRPR